MNEIGAAIITWAAGQAGADASAQLVRDRASGISRAVLVEGLSDAAAVEALSLRRGRSLDEEGVVVVPMEGATNIRRFLDLLVPLAIPVAGLCDAAEERFFRRALDLAGLGPVSTREGLEALGFFVCERDLEDELIRALGADGVEAVIDNHGDLAALRTFQNQPFQRGRQVEDQLRRFVGTMSGRKIGYARTLVAALAPGQVPRPLEQLLVGS